MLCMQDLLLSITGSERAAHSGRFPHAAKGRDRRLGTDRRGRARRVPHPRLRFPCHHDGHGDTYKPREYAYRDKQGRRLKDNQDNRDNF